MDGITEVLKGELPLKPREQAVNGRLVERGGEPWLVIEGFDRMAPFLVSVVSGYDHWMYVSSTGGLTCGRRNPDHALFPYETDDRIHDAHATAGPFTVMRLQRDGRRYLWEPLRRGASAYRVERNLYKNLVGNRLVFEEINHDLGVAFDYEWSCGDRFGFIRQATLRNLGADTLRAELLDGIRNLLPSGVEQAMQATRSTLLDAYRQAEILSPSGAGVYTLSSIPTDRAEPSEALKATVVWQTGLPDPCLLLSTDQADAFRTGSDPLPETERRGRRADYLAGASLELPGGGHSGWYMAADVDLGAAQAVELLRLVAAGIDPEELERDIARSTHRLRRLVGAADGFQQSADPLKTARHFSNTLFNIMRGGVFLDAYRLPAEDFLHFAHTWNHAAGKRFQALLDGRGQSLDRADLLEVAERSGDPDLQRLALEYLPLTFSRRHGDPSRPWNHFDIDIRGDDGSDRIAYQGNWRDIFQNWEALSISYPAYLDSFVARFVNASTPDGFNPYRISQDGIDWEVLDTSDPWSNIGYWGDHQVNYLLKLLERWRDYHPGALSRLLGSERFVYADVPYRIHGYRDLLADPHRTVDYDEDHATLIAARVARNGSDGRLVTGPGGSIHRVNLFEKLLLTALVRLGNLVPGGGVWMNTQRPEWNDANNALVGYGLSMVTLCYLRRYLAFLEATLAGAGLPSFRVSREVSDFFSDIEALLAGTGGNPGEDGVARKAFVDRAGAASERYRARVYAGFSGEREELETARIRAFARAALGLLDDSIAANRREDGLYHAYNLLAPGETAFDVEHLPEMLEGQVAVLASGTLSPSEALELLDTLRRSALYREDQESYLLYPAARLPGFLDKNRITEEEAQGDDWIRQELDTGATGFIERDGDGQVRFNGRFRNAAGLRQALLAERSVEPATAERLGRLFEQVFHHRRFTGRSGTMYKYEGLGCIYWHMVSKLLLDVGELLARSAGEAAAVLDGLHAHYRQIEAGLGVHKSPGAYGAFPTDPYSHTPAFAGVQQPGMTGQVKEDIISRFVELGVRVEGGRLRFEPAFLERREFSSSEASWAWSDGVEERQQALAAGSLAFSLCGVPVVYRVAEQAAIRLEFADGGIQNRDGAALDSDQSRSLFDRDGRIVAIEVYIPAGSLR